MRVGTVQLVEGALRPIVRVYVEGPNQSNSTRRVLVDTGFSGYLALQGWLIDHLGLTPAGSAKVRFANDQVARLELFHADVYFGGRNRSILVHRTESVALAGMSLLGGNVIKIDARVGGAVEVEAPSGPVG